MRVGTTTDRSPWATGQLGAALVVLGLLVLLVPVTDARAGGESGPTDVRTAAFGPPVDVGGDRLSLNVRQLCKKAGLRPPKMLLSKSEITVPGDSKKQYTRSYAYYRPMPKVCHDKYMRIPQAKMQMQSPKNHRRWFNISNYSWPTLYDHGPGVEDPRVGNIGGITRVKHFRFPFGIRDKRKLYRCTPGKGVTHVRALYKSVVRDLETGKTIGRSRIRRAPIRVRYIDPKTANELGVIGQAC